MFSFGASAFDTSAPAIPAANYYSPSMPAAQPAPQAAAPVTGPAEMSAGGTGTPGTTSWRPAGFPAANTTASGLPAGMTIGGVTSDASGNVPSGGGGATSGGINYGQLLAGTAKGIGHNIGTMDMAGAQNTAIPQAPSGYKPVLANIAFVDPSSNYQKPVVMG